MKELTLKQRNVLDFISSSLKSQGESPSYHEIADHFGLNSVATVALHIRALIRKGFLTKDEWRARSLCPKGLEPPDPGSTASLPVIGFVPAGPAQMPNEEIERVIWFDRYLVKSNNCFVIRVKGTSMKGAGVMDGDMVIVKRQSTADSGDLVIALKDGEATLKRYIPKKNGVLLKAENPKSKSYFVPNNPDSQISFDIIGKVIKIIRDV